MKAYIKALFLLPALITGLGLIPAGRMTAQTVTNLHGFTFSDGVQPYGRLLLSGNTLYGTAGQGGGSPGYGTVFAINTNGTSFAILHKFAGYPSDGIAPDAGLIVSGNTLYGTTFQGGSSGYGTVFAMNTNGTGFTILHSFTGGDGGAKPWAGLMLSGNTLYGTAYGAGSGKSTVFAVKTNGTGFTNLYSFTETSGSASTNSDGTKPRAGLILSGDTLYGTTFQGGSSGNGTVFAVNTDGTGFTTLHSFTALNNSTNSDGTLPLAGLILSGNTLYGTAAFGGSSGNGTVFAVNTNGTGSVTLHSFTATACYGCTNTDGASPQAGLTLSGNTLYGTTDDGGSSGWGGTVFAININGTGFTNLYNFTESGSSAELILSGNTWYGTTRSGGGSGYGTVFSLSLPPPPTPPPQLTLIPYGANVILTWPTNNAGFTLQSTTNLVSPAVWSANSPRPVVIGGQNVVFNPVSGPQQFYRLGK